MVEKGLLEKYHTTDNKKNVIIRVSDLGRKEYEAYSRYAYKKWFEDLFAMLDEIPEEYVDAASCVQVDNGAEGYGYLFWRGPYNSFRADGKYGV